MQISTCSKPVHDFGFDNTLTAEDVGKAAAMKAIFQGELKRVADVVQGVASGFLKHHAVADAVQRSDMETFSDAVERNLAIHDFNGAAINIYGLESIFDPIKTNDKVLIDVAHDMRRAISHLAGHANESQFNRSELVLAEEYANKVAEALGLEVALTLAAVWSAKPIFSNQAGEIKAADADQIIQGIGRGQYVVWPRAMLHGAEPLVGNGYYHVGKDGLVSLENEIESGFSL